MATIKDYASLSASIGDWTHRQDLITGSPPFSDSFIQAAQERISNDVFDQNFGQGLQWMEASYAASVITGGTLPLPADWLAPEIFYVSDGQSNQYTLIWKSPSWIYTNYEIRQADDIPAFIARNVMPSASFTASLTSSGVLAVTALASGLLQVGMILSDTTSALPAATPGNAVIITGQSSGVSGSTGNYSAASVNPLQPTYTIASEAMSGGGNVFIFGPYPDQGYQVSGTYYQSAPLLAQGEATTNWMVINAPMLLLAACMVEAAKFLKDATMMQTWEAVYTPRLQAIIDRDKAERWGAATMQVEVA